MPVRSIAGAGLALILVAGCAVGMQPDYASMVRQGHYREACEQYANQQGQMFGMSGRGLSGEMNAQVWQQRCVESQGRLLLKG